jgi:3-ketosteroid 9alpha-monooxygenase subunit A
MAKAVDYDLGKFTFPRGWFMIAEATEVTDKPLALRFFGRDLVLYRGESGTPYLLDAYCPHMGTHLGANTTSYVVRDGAHIQGEAIRCPYHGWRFGPDGKCVEIPYGKVIPKAATIKSWPIVERMGVIFVWYDAEDDSPEFDEPNFGEWGDPAWVRWKIDHMGTMQSHPQEILDNMVDVGHFSPTHGSVDIAYFENEFNGPTVIQRFGAGHRTLVTDKKLLELVTWYTGPGILLSRMLGDFPTIMMIAHTPVDDGVIKVWHALMVKSSNAVATEDDVRAARAYQEESRLAFAQDFEIWSNKRPAFNILQVPGDGPFHKLRIWYKQFYNPREDAGIFHQRANGIYVSRGADVRRPEMVS